MKKSNKVNKITYIYFLIVSILIMTFIFTLNYLFPDFTKNTIYYTSNAITLSFNNNDLTKEEMINYIRKSSDKNLDTEKKDYLINEDLFNDILNISNKDRYYFLRRNLTNIGIEYFDNKELDTEIAGYYNPLTPNKIHLLNDSKETFYNNSAHEFIHLLQDNTKYTYIREASAEILAYEYFNSYPNSYQDARNRVYILMEIIGSKPIFECNFKGDTSNFETTIYNYLGKKDGNKLLKLFTYSPSDKNIIKINSEIDKLLYKMYKNTDKESFIDYIYESDNIYKIYFNKNSSNYNKNQNIIDNYTNYNKYEINYNEYQENSLNNNYYKRKSIISNNNFYDIENIGILDIKTSIIHNYEEAITNGYVDDYKYYKLVPNLRNT